MSKTFARIDDQLVAIELDEKGLRTRMATDSEKAEHALMSATGIMGESEIGEIIEGTYSKFKESFKKDLNRNVAKLMGFEVDQWSGEIKVDHCNNRMSYVGDMVSKKAQEYVLKVSEEPIEFDDTLKAEIRKALKKDLKDRIGYTSREVISRIIHNMIETEAKAYIQQVAQPHVQAIVKKKVDSLLTEKHPSPYAGEEEVENAIDQIPTRVIRGK